MASFLVLAAAVVVAACVAAQFFSLRTVRCAALISALVLVWFTISYGIAHWGTTHPGAPPPNLADAFNAGADAIVASLLRPLLGGNGAPPGLIGRIVIALLLALGYRTLEWRARQLQAPQLNSASLSDDQPGGKQADADAAAAASSPYAQRHAQLTAELRFRLAAIDVRAPAILPGGSRVSGLASIAETSGVGGAGLAGALIRFLGSVWPSPRQFRLRVWVESQPAPIPQAGPQPQPGPMPQQATDCRVTVYLENPRNGDTVATKTLAGQDVDEATSRVAGFVARQIFANDPDTPPWCHGRADGADLGALLLARQVRTQAETPDGVADSRQEQIGKLRQWASGGKAAGIARYELAQLLDLEGDHLGALCLHARNLADYPRFYRGRYRLGMSLEMVANPGLMFPDSEETRRQLDEILAVLHRAHLTERTGLRNGDLRPCDSGQARCTLSPSLRLDLLSAAARVLRTVRLQLTRRHVVWATLWYRDERRVWLPYWPWWLLGRRHAQRWAFHDGVRVAGLLVAIRIKLIGLELGGTRDDDAELGSALRRATALCAESWGEYRSGVECASAIAGDGAIIDWVLSQGERWVMSGPPPGPADSARDRGARRGKPRRKRASWQAAYNAACLYAALAARGLTDQRQAVSCLRQTVDSQHSELERPSDWMERDPDLAFLAGQRPGESPGQSPGQQGEPTPFTRFLDAQKRLDYPAAYLQELTAQPQPQAHPRLPEQRQQTPPATLRGPGYQPVTGDALGAHITTMHD